MSATIAKKLATLGHDLPVASVPVANYVSVVRAGTLLSISGQISRIDDENAVLGVVGASVSLEEG
ncbi:MAG: RidA family protein, partial [Phyllobacterium sp.]|nr:RidA family protein [Phyllobacterium sp.]